MENVRRGVGRFQALCDEFQVRPTYLVDAPVVEDAAAADLLRGIQDSGRAEIGAHVHPWCNPPLGEQLNSRNSYLCNLPEPVQRDKIAWLTDAIEDRFGRRPTSFRAGRYGLDIVGARILLDLGYAVDSSVTPFTSHARDGGPDFSGAPYQPYRIAAHDLCRAAAFNEGATGLLEVPVSVGFNRRNFRLAHAIRQRAGRSWLGKLRCVGILDRLGIVRRIRFSPEQASGPELKTLADAYCRQGASCVVLIFHSSSLVAGGSPYVPDAAALERFYHRLRDLFEEWAQRGRTAATLSGFAQRFNDSQACLPPRAMAAAGR